MISKIRQLLLKVPDPDPGILVNFGSNQIWIKVLKLLFWEAYPFEIIRIFFFLEITIYSTDFYIY